MSEKIEVGYRHIGTQMGKEFHHKFLLYTNTEGKQFTISGWADKEHATNALPYGKIAVLHNEPYTYTNPDYPRTGNDAQNIYFEKIIQAEDLSVVWKQMQTSAISKHNIYPYDPMKQNSNSLADSVLRDVGLHAPQQDGFNQHWAPASDKKLDINLQPQDPEVNGTSKNLSNVISQVDINNWQHKKVHFKAEQDKTNEQAPTQAVAQNQSTQQPQHKTSVEHCINHPSFAKISPAEQQMALAYAQAKDAEASQKQTAQTPQQPSNVAHNDELNERGLNKRLLAEAQAESAARNSQGQSV
jgi:hypothetical protein